MKIIAWAAFLYLFFITPSIQGTEFEPSSSLTNQEEATIQHDTEITPQISPAENHLPAENTLLLEEKPQLLNTDSFRQAQMLTDQGAEVINNVITLADAIKNKIEDHNQRFKNIHETIAYALGKGFDEQDSSLSSIKYNHLQNNFKKASNYNQKILTFVTALDKEIANLQELQELNEKSLRTLLTMHQTASSQEIFNKIKENLKVIINKKDKLESKINTIKSFIEKLNKAQAILHTTVNNLYQINKESA